MDISELIVFLRRMKRLNIDIELVGNYPWIYIDTINGKRVIEKFYGEHGFTIAFYPNYKITDITEIFKLLRKYNPNYTKTEKIFNKIYE